MRILALSTAIPFPPVSGGKLRTYHLLRALSGAHDLTLAGFTYGEQPGWPPFAVRVMAVPWEPPPLYRQMEDGDGKIAQQAADQLSGSACEPWCVSWAESAAMTKLIQQVAKEPFDLVLVAGTPMARFLPALPRKTPKILDFMDVYTRMALRQVEGKQGAEAARAAGELERVRRFEQSAAQRCDRCLAVSEEETAAVKELFGCTHAETVANGVDTTYFHPGDEEPEPGNLLFTGTMSYRPNAEAVLYFVEDILPLIVRELPAAKLHVVGDAPPKAITALSSRHVAVHGFVSDMRVYHGRAAVVVVPLLRGGGTKLKVLEAAAMGKAIVTTSVGAEGLAFRDGKELTIADAPGDFARAVVALAGDRSRARQLGANARRVALQYDWDKIGERFCAIVESLAEKRAVDPASAC